MRYKYILIIYLGDASSTQLVAVLSLLMVGSCNTDYVLYGGAKLFVWVLLDPEKQKNTAKQSACQNVNKAISVPL